jgi:hypothetical protein
MKGTVKKRYLIVNERNWKVHLRNVIEVGCDGFSHVVSNKSTMRVSHTTSYFCVRDKGYLQPLLLRGHTRAGT